MKQRKDLEKRLEEMEQVIYHLQQHSDPLKEPERKSDCQLQLEDNTAKIKSLTDKVESLVMADSILQERISQVEIKYQAAKVRWLVGGKHVGSRRSASIFFMIDLSCSNHVRLLNNYLDPLIIPLSTDSTAL